MTGRHPAASSADRRAFERQQAALIAAANNNEGDARWEATVVDWANAQRAAQGEPALKEWWESKTETELHERARTLGLLG